MRSTLFMTTVFSRSWEDLRDQREMVEYSMSLSADASRKKNLVPGSKARR